MTDPNGTPPNTDDAATPAADPGAVVNPQIVDAVRTSTGFAFGLENKLQAPVDNGTRLSSGAAVAYEKAAQAAAFAVQDATDYQRNVMSISNVAQGKALAMMFADKEHIATYAQILVLAMASSLAAVVTAGEVGAQATKMLQSFPRA